jgi:predicted Zn-dependent peptidase
MNFSKTTALFIVAILLFVLPTFSQTGEPRQESLLNGLKLLTWNDAKAEKTTVILRIHSGSSFDPKDKMGVMAMLSDILFPSEQTKEFFQEDLEGSLEVTSNYDYIQISATAKSDEFLTILETLATAVSNPQITVENFKKIREARLKLVQDLQKNPSYVADKLVAKRLLGDFPYGRASEGTPESLAKIDKADLIFARDKFLLADNATIAIIGNVRPDYVLRAVKRYFGGWKKSERIFPSTFALPEDANSQKLVVNSDLVDKNEVRYAFKNLGRTDKDYFALRFLSDILSSREIGSNFSIKSQRNILPSLMIVSVKNISDEEISANDKAKTASELFGGKLFATISSAEFDKTRTKILAEIDKKPLVEKWLDTDSFHLGSVKEEIQKLNAVTLADVQRVADKLGKQTFVTVVLTKPVAVVTPSN